jgi:hypothetical protein
MPKVLPFSSKNALIQPQGNSMVLPSRLISDLLWYFFCFFVVFKLMQPLFWSIKSIIWCNAWISTLEWHWNLMQVLVLFTTCLPLSIHQHLVK